MTRTSEDEWNSQIRRGVLELAVLALIARRPMYGYEIVSTLAEQPELEVAEGTLYPILRRLRKEGVLSTSWVESDAGPPRQYYQLTAAGTKRLTKFTAQWRALGVAVESLLQKGR